ncbi:hypothetical protein X801_05739 [Opisthorchis viverrini]|uniref:Reverse transcriptase domain-containing protein n=1 Tax=Opisthorchis viverrini TaxID=6198 RepID=A0A1S8WV84_OPIVI|nr:hypothetical protein X801_05739 [Opisthorchis viverrini]
MEENPRLLCWIVNNKASLKPGISPLHTPNGLTATASAAAEELAEFCSTVCCQKEYMSRMSFVSPSPPTTLHEVTQFILKQCAHSLYSPLAELLSSSLNTGGVPNDWKKGVITPIYKGGNRSVVSNYRPVTPLPVISEVLKRLVANQIIKRLGEN